MFSSIGCTVLWRMMPDVMQDLYLPLARQYQGLLPFVKSHNIELAKRFSEYLKNSEPAITLVMVKFDPRDAAPKYTIFPGRSIDHLRDWIEEHRFPLVSELDSINFEDVTTRGLRTLVAVVDQDQPYAKEYAQLDNGYEQGTSPVNCELL
jgi:hypothetical protein